LHKLLSAQLQQATKIPGQTDSVQTDSVQLIELVDTAYRAHDQELERCAREVDRIAEELARANRERKRLVAALEEQTLRFTIALDNMSHGMCLFDADKRLVLSNRRYAEIYGLAPEQVRPGMTLKQVFDLRSRTGSDPKLSYEEYINWVPSRESVYAPTGAVVELKNGRTVAIRHQPMEGGDYVATHEDITERRAAEAKIAHMAHHDALTGLPNRLLFKERLQQALAHVGRGQACAVLYLDLDYFKTINDTLGHPLGDGLLGVVAQRLRRSVRQTDTVARLGGDEFAIVQNDVRDSASTRALAERLVNEIGAPYNLDGHHVVIGTCIGIARGPVDGADPDQLMRNADLALYSAKLEGRGRYCFFKTEMAEIMEQRRVLELELRAAIMVNEFEVFYQPLVSLETGRIRGFEALLRWNSPTRGMVSASEFIPLTEEIGLAIDIGEWVVDQACAEAATWPEELSVSVNVSAEQLRSGTLLSVVAAALRRSGLASARLELEITETAVIQDPEAARAVLRQLKDFGVSIALDDFGTGYSSLSYVREFPFDRIKIDRTFVRDLCQRPDSIAIVRAITGLCSSLGIATTAEGVETDEQLAILRAERCNEVQGYLFSRPCPAGDIPELLKSFAKTRIARTKPAIVLLEARG
jgi:diguanylate cyclase (GGDEF)-like protein/PAS domain S-box-containing protein